MYIYKKRHMVKYYKKKKKKLWKEACERCQNLFEDERLKKRK